jgi:hypothetical protein
MQVKWQRHFGKTIASFGENPGKGTSNHFILTHFEWDALVIFGSGNQTYFSGDFFRNEKPSACVKFQPAVEMEP